MTSVALVGNREGFTEGGAVGAEDGAKLGPDENEVAAMLDMLGRSVGVLLGENVGVQVG